MRDYRKLEVFALADELALKVYDVTRAFPAEERYGLSAQLRRAAVSTAANIVEGASRSTDREFAHFLSVAYGSVCELAYELSLARRLGFASETGQAAVEGLADRVCKALRSLILAVRSAVRETSGQRAS